MGRLVRNRVLAIGFSALVTALPAFAQESPSKYPPACDASQVTKSDVDRAHSVFLSGKQYLEESNYDKAISYFNDAYSIDCSIHAILPIIATAYERKGDKAEAIRALEEYQKRAPDSPDHEVIEHRIKNLKDQLAHEAPAAPSAAPSASAGPSASVGSPPEAPAPPVASAPPVLATPPPPPPETTPAEHTVGPWLLVGVGGAAVAAGIVLYAVGAGDISSAENTCPGRRCPITSPSEVSTGNDGRTLVTVGGIVGGVGLAAAATGLIWHFVEKPRHASAAGAITPIIAPGYAGVAGAF